MIASYKIFSVERRLRESEAFVSRSLAPAFLQASLLLAQVTLCTCNFLQLFLRRYTDLALPSSSKLLQFFAEPAEQALSSVVDDRPTIFPSAEREKRRRECMVFL